MFNSKSMWVHRWFIFVFVGVVLSSYYTLQTIFTAEHRLRRSMYDDFSEESDNYTATNIVMAHLNAQVKEMTHLSKIKTLIETTNAAQTIFNDHLYSNLNNKHLVVVVRVNKARDHLQHMIASLSKSFGYTKLFVIFVHDCNDEDINNLVKGIDFVKYMQLFYPYDYKIFLNNYPGQDPNYCNQSYSCFEDVGRRNATLVQQKHLWWWTVNQVFRLDVMINYTQYVLFVDEHSYFVEDLVYVIRLMQLALGIHCPDCMMMNFGGNDLSVSYFDTHPAYITIEPFGASDFTNGIAFNRSTWNKIKAQKESYCYFNDYSWTESLKNLIKLAPEKFLVLSSFPGPRIFDTSKCEATSQNLTCEFDGVKMNMTTFIPLVKRCFFPRGIHIIPKDIAEAEVFQRGGWEDIRDKELCMFLASKAKNSFGFRL